MDNNRHIIRRVTSLTQEYTIERKNYIWNGSINRDLNPIK